MKQMRDTHPMQGLLHFPGTLHNERMVPVRVVWMSATKSLIDEDRHLQLMGNPEGGVQGRILMTANGMMHPVQDEFAGGPVRRLADHSDTLRQVLGQIAGIKVPVSGGVFDHGFHPLPVVKKKWVGDLKIAIILEK
jgi:hypothetical protein